MRTFCFATAIFIFMNIPGVSAQRLSRAVIGIAGNCHSNSGSYISYTLGQGISGTFIKENSILTQGFQQPLLLNFDEVDSLPQFDDIKIYPNPVSSDQEIHIAFMVKEMKVYTVEIFSSQGIKQEAFYKISPESSCVYTINMSDYPHGIYMIHVYSREKEINRIFKIEKL